MASENILSHFWDLASIDEAKRLKAASQLLCALKEAQNEYDRRPEVNGRDNKNNKEEDDDKICCCEELKYSVTRLVKGLASSRKGARQGFATVLTEVLSEFDCLSPEKILRLITKNLEVTGSAKAWEERDSYIGQVFGLTSIFRSQFKQEKISSPNSEWLSLLITRVRELSKKKSYLQELCAKVIVDIFAVVSPDVFRNSVYPSVKDVLESGWEQATPETLLILFALQRCWGDHIDKKLVKVAWKSSFIADKQNYEQIQAVLQESISSHPRVHCIWDEVFLTLLDNSASDFQLFWNTVVEECLFQSTHDRKFLGFQLVKKVLPQISANQVPVVFGSNMMRSFINNLSSSKSYLHEAAKQLGSCLPSLVNQNKDPDVPVLVLKQLLGRNGRVYFDSLTKTKTVENLLGTLKGSGPQTFVTWLLEVFERGNVEGSTDLESEYLTTKRTESTRIAVLNQLYQLVKKKTVSREGDWIQAVLFFLLEHAYFQPIKGDTEAPLKLSVRQTSEQRFVSVMKELSSSKEMKQLELYRVVQHAKKLLDSDELSVVSDQWTEEAEKAFKKAVKLVEKIHKKKRKSENVQQEDEVFGLLFSHIALQLFIEPEQAMDLLKELKACYERQKNEEENIEEPHWVEVLTEVLLSLLTRPSSLFRHVVDQVFTILAPYLTLDALSMILESLDPRKRDKGETLEIVDESGADEEDDEEMEDDEAEPKGSANGTKAEDVDDSDDEDDVESGSDEEEDTAGEVDEAFRAEIQAALGPAVVDMDGKGSSSDEDLDDEAMMKLDDALAAVFKTRLQAKKEKNNKKDTAKIVLHFKLRVLDIIEIFIKKQPSNPLVLELIDPLLDVAWSSLHSKDFHTLGEKAQALFKNKLCTSKELPPTSSIDAKDVHDKIEHLVQKALSAPSITIVSLITRGCLYLVRVLRGSQAKESSVSSKSESNTRQDRATEKVNLLNAQRVTVVFRMALKDFMEKRSTHLHPVLFTELISRFPHLGWYLAPDLVRYLESAVNNFRKSQACVMLLKLIPQKTPEHSQHIKDIAPSMLSTLNSLMTKASTPDTDLKAKHLRDLLKLATKFINEAKKTEVFASLQIDKLEEGVTLILESVLLKKAPDMKGICNTILSSLSRSDNVKQNKGKNFKRKLEENELLADESAAVSTEGGSDKAKKRKKKAKN